MTDEARLFYRFTSKIREDESGCWIWTASLDSHGYGQFQIGTSRRSMIVRAHKFLWEKLNGPVPGGLQLDHLCRVPRCVNPDHLEPVTPRVNQLRGNTLGAKNAAKTHCLRGHELSEANIWRQPGTNKRACRECKRIRRRGEA